MSDNEFLIRLHDLADVYEKERNEHYSEVQRLKARIQELEQKGFCVCQAWQPCEKDCVLNEGERIVIRNNHGNEMMMTFSHEIMQLFLQYKQWLRI